MEARDAPAWDTDWLEELAAVLGEGWRGDRRPVDLYLERRLEVRLVRLDGAVEGIRILDQGCAARWRSGNGLLTAAANGLGRSALAGVLAAGGHRGSLPVPSRDGRGPQPPPGWRDRAAELLASLPGGTGRVRCLRRAAAVVRQGSWAVVASPPLLEVRSGPEDAGSLLAVWGHDSLQDWLGALAARPRHSGWLPEPGSSRPVVFEEGSAGVLVHELIGHMVESDLVATGMSPLASRLGSAVGPPSLHVVDDPLREDLPGCFDHDDEGIPARPRTLVKGGLLVGWLCDGEGARRLDCEAGRGRRAGWQHPPVPRMSNLITAPGTTPPAELERAVAKGLVVTRVGAATVDPASGRVVLRVEEGWELLHGRRRRPLAPCHLTGDVPGVLSGIQAEMGDDPTPAWRTGWCHKDARPVATAAVTPSLVVEGLEVV